jgi:predicted transcriptional regulator
MAYQRLIKNAGPSLLGGLYMYESGHNTVRKIREKLLISKAELARKAGISQFTIDRIEKGMSCRIETKRKIILAFGYDLSEKGLIFTNN